VSAVRAPSAFAALVALALAATPAPSQELTGTLKKVRDQNAISIGYRESSVPFSYLDQAGKPVGYSIDLCLEIVDEIEGEIGASEIEVRYRKVTSATRIPALLAGEIDLECGSTTNNAERQKQVAFSDTIFVIGTRLLTKKSSGINDFPDLKGKNVVTTAGTTSERLIRKMNEEKKMGMNIISAKDHGDSFLALESGRAVAFMMDDALLAGEMAKARKPDEWHIVGTPQSREAYGCMLRKDDPQFKKVVDDAIAKAMTSGEAEKLYKKWFESPIPPKGLNLNLPLSDDMKKLFKNPNDKALD
jgi:glutamate/aspartate transport system substrate-binding protein